MRVLALAHESYPTRFARSFALLHQAMALEELGHEVHLYNVHKPPLPLAAYLEAYDLDLILGDLDLVATDTVRTPLAKFRRLAPVRVIGFLYSLPGPAEAAWELVDFAATPWRGATVERLARNHDLRYLPFGYNRRLHRRAGELPRLGAVYAGNLTSTEDRAEAQEYLAPLVDERTVLPIGAGFAQPYLDPYALGSVYAAARCLPNFHYARAKGEDLLLNERFFQTSRCGIPVHDYSPLMEEVLGKELAGTFCVPGKTCWQDRVRALVAGVEQVDTRLLDRLDAAFEGHSYHERMQQLLNWIL